MSAPVKLCKDCRWASFNGYAGWMCSHPMTGNENKVDGLAHVYCSVERTKQFDSINACGSAAKLWEARLPGPPKPHRWWQFWRASTSTAPGGAEGEG